MLLVSNINYAKKLARKFKANFVLLEEVIYPDSEVALKLSDSIKRGGKIVVYFQFSLNKSFDEQILNLFSLLYYINDKKDTTLILPYLPYARSLPLKMKWEIDKLGYFLGELSRFVGRIYFVKPHCNLSVIKKYLKNVKGQEVAIENSIVKFLKSRFKDFILVSPDYGFSGYTKKLAKLAQKDYLVLKKERLSPEQVQIRCKDENFKTFISKQFIIVDDMVSTGGTLLKAIKLLRGGGVKKISCFIVHNLLTNENVANEFKKQKVKLFCASSLGCENSQVDIFNDIYKTLIK